MIGLMDDEKGTPPQSGMPRWLIYGIAAKLALVIVITLGIVWYAFGR
ncbi:hypothetical protein IM511_06965 [Erythrobacteraceae bacterium E2-1 Yellow Sea]|nr:hypothetical protein [Erythrobacteraceae bacterium E2-1 Yellow Sea]